MRNYEVTFIVDPVLSGDEIKATAQTYVEHLESTGCKIVAVDEMGLRQLAYPIKRRNSGVYYSIEFQNETGSLIDRLELALRRDERIMRFLTVALDKYGVKYNEDKRNGLIGKARKIEKKTKDRGGRSSGPRSSSKPADSRKESQPAKAEVKKEAQPVKAAVKKEEEE